MYLSVGGGSPLGAGGSKGIPHALLRRLNFELFLKPQSSLRNRKVHKAKVQTEKLKPDELLLQTLNLELRTVSLPHPKGYSRT
jgi:hypothetical protein